jgi:hypothetical protein
MTSQVAGLLVAVGVFLSLLTAVVSVFSFLNHDLPVPGLVFATMSLSVTTAVVFMVVLVGSAPKE